MQCMINLVIFIFIEYDSFFIVIKRGSGGNGSGINGVCGIQEYNEIVRVGRLNKKENIFFLINFFFNFYNKSVEVYKIGY